MSLRGGHGSGCPKAALPSPHHGYLILVGARDARNGEGKIMKAEQLAVAGAGIAAALLIALPALAQSSRPHPQITITNQRTVPLSNFAIATPGDQPRLVAKLAKPLAPGKSIALKLNKPQGCAYTVQAQFADEAESDADMDLCKDRVIRLTE
jgi:hypothetical protein